eukprot:410619-Pleurochrysis_carterae.AAC.1
MTLLPLLKCGSSETKWPCHATAVTSARASRAVATPCDHVKSIGQYIGAKKEERAASARVRASMVSWCARATSMRPLLWLNCSEMS